MKKKLFQKGLVFGIIFLFLGIAVQPITSTDIEHYNNPKQIEIEPLSVTEYKEYLFETIIQIANKPEVNDLIEQNGKDLISLDTNLKAFFEQELANNPFFYYSMVFAKPSFSHEYFNKAYNKGVRLSNIIGFDKTLEVLESINFSNNDFMYELVSIITNDEELYNRISTLEQMNLEVDEPPGFVCLCLGLLILAAMPPMSFFGFLYDIFDLLGNPAVANFFFLMTIPFQLSLLFFLAIYVLIGCWVD